MMVDVKMRGKMFVDVRGCLEDVGGVAGDCLKLCGHPTSLIPNPSAHQHSTSHLNIPPIQTVADIYRSESS